MIKHHAQLRSFLPQSHEQKSRMTPIRVKRRIAMVRQQLVRPLGFMGLQINDVERNFGTLRRRGHFPIGREVLRNCRPWSRGILRKS